jgi:NAD(P)H-dependent FMN reductase
VNTTLRLPVILGSVRRGRRSPVVAQFIHDRLTGRDRVATELVDLADLDLPVMEERLRLRDDPPAGLEDLAQRIDLADGLVIVTPEYNNGIPGALKNALDYLLPELERKPTGIVTVSAGSFGGISCLAQLRLVLLAMGALPIPASLPVPRVQDAFDDSGRPTDSRFTERADRFLDETLWWIEAAARQRRNDHSRSS